ncbi:MAG TPA: ribosome maturation factor RimM [Candidatus Binatia bacterium]|nr:ribosome maturation factor RimM [Candidatus Binatia bacterium]
MRPAPSASTSKSPPAGVVLGPDGERLVVIGELAGPHGVRGEARLRPFNPHSSVLAGVSDVFLLGDEAATRRLRLERARPHGGVWLVILEGFTTREAVRALHGSRLAVRERDLPRLEAGQFYCYQLVGIAVFDDSGRALGRVSEVLSTSGNDVLVVRGSGRERLIPMIDQAVGEVDLEGGRIVVHPLEGLLD